MQVSRVRVTRGAERKLVPHRFISDGSGRYIRMTGVPALSVIIVRAFIILHRRVLRVHFVHIEHIESRRKF